MLIHPAFSDYMLIKLIGYSTKYNFVKDYRTAKKAIDTGWQRNKGLNDAQIAELNKNKYWIGGQVPSGHIVIDVDNKEKGKLIYEGLLKAGFSFIGIETPNGYQFIFKDTGRVKTQMSRQLTLCGIVVDYKLAGKGYIVLPTENTPGRQVIHNPNKALDPMPLMFLPVRLVKKTDIELDAIPDGARSTTLISHASKIREWDVAHSLNLTADEKRQVLNEVNSTFCYPPKTQNEINSIFKSAESYPVISEQKVTNVTDVTFTDNNLISISPFPFDVFPHRLLSIIEKLSNALHVEPELLASSMLTIVSGAIGNTVRVSPKQGYEVTLFIWLIIIALSGYGKSPVIQNLLKHIKQLQAKSYQKYQDNLKEYERQLRKSKDEKGIDIPDKPKLRHSIVSDCTVEALANVFENDGRGVVIYQDEIAGLILGLDQYKGKGNDRQHYLELFNADSWKRDRKSGVQFVPNTGASIIGGIQPKVMPRIFNADSFDDGLLPRFLLLNAENGSMKFSRQSIAEDTVLYWISLLDWCYALPLSYDDLGFIQPKVLSLSSEALTEYENFYNGYGDRMPFLSERAKVFIPKLTAYYSLKFAGILQAIKAFDKGASIIGSLIDAETIKDAIGLTHFFAGQAIKSLRHYEGDSLTEYQKRLVNVLYALQGEVTGGKLPLSRIVDTFNNGLPEAVKHTPHKISAMLKELELTTEKSSHNLSILQWEAEKIQCLFSKTNVTKVTKVTSNDRLQAEKVTNVTNVTFNPENEVIDLTGVDFEVVE